MFRLLSRCLRPPSRPTRSWERTVFCFNVEWQPSLDMEFVIENKELIKENIKNRKIDVDLDSVLSDYDAYCKLKVEEQELKDRVTSLRKAVRGGGVSEEKKATMTDQLCDLSDRTDVNRPARKAAYIKHRDSAVDVPNSISPHTPVGDYEKAQVVDTVGERPTFAFKHRDYIALSNIHRLLDQPSALFASGPNRMFLRGPAAMLEQAIISYVFQLIYSKPGFEPVLGPDIIRESVVKACGYVPRGDKEQMFRLGGEDDDLVLSGTGELQIAGMCSSSGHPSHSLPRKYVTVSHCFRREAEGGMFYRMNQFSKVELFAITQNDVEKSDAVLMQFVNIQKEILSSLGLHGRLLEMPTEELGNPAYRKLDFEVWMPGYDDYKEVCSASNCLDYQARRLQIYKGGYRTPRLPAYPDRVWLHTVNATAAAIPRLIIALIETHQREDGTIGIPECLRPFLGNRECFSPPSPPRTKDFRGNNLIRDFH
ncbi:uncharacterized protein LOC135820996 [Sycon ciliatum]|uniref:uncharacterized protein LOC135820996 n=1 Tax=Sycon ciliatum TaxID=27933 RepID=UPI0031F602F1